MGQKGASVDGFMAFCYWNLAEPLAETAPIEEISGAALCASGATESELPAVLLGGDASFSAKTLAQSNPVGAIELMAGDSPECMPPRHMQHMTMTAFYDLYVLWCKGNHHEDDVAKMGCFSQIYDQWKQLLQFREVSQHVSLQHERDQLEQAQSIHVRNTRMYRTTQTRLNSLSEQSVQQGSSDCCVLKLDIVVECYFVLEPDVPKDSSTEVTCIMKALDHAAAILKSRGCPMPPHLIIEDFVDIIKAKVHPVRNRELRAEVLFGSLDIKSYYDQLGLYVSGLVSSRNPD
ncbi:unnamed protein product, partial [Durusdinium trenchii]